MNTGVKCGGWVLLKNVHLASEWLWLWRLEKRLHSLQLEANPNPRPNLEFRLFVAPEITAQLPGSFLTRSLVLIVE